MALFSDLISNIKGLFVEAININGYVFDVYLRMSQSSSSVITKHPTEIGSVISDNAYNEPISFNFEIGMTDTAQGKVFGQFGYYNRSVKAYKVLHEMWKSRSLLTLNGKYGFYRNIIIKSIDVDDDNTTVNAMKARVVLEQVPVVKTNVIKVSANPNYTDKVNRGKQAVSEASSNQSSLVSLGVPGGFL